MELKTKNGNIIPPIGLGTFPLQGRQLADVICAAYKIGYRLIDTSDDYRGETGVGMALELLQSEGVSRNDIFIQTKISADGSFRDEPLKGFFFNPNNDFMTRHTVDEIVREKVEISLRELKTDYIDSILIHVPYYKFYEKIWNVLCQLKQEGLVRYIGVSNFSNRHIDKLISDGYECPSINEIYISPLGTKQERIDYSFGKIQLMTYSPLIDIPHNNLPVEYFDSLVTKYNKSLAQIILRWNIDRGCIPLPKTQNVKRLKENFDVLDFKLTNEEIKYVNALNRDYEYLVESKICPGI